MPDPRFSVFTPTHDTRRLADCYRSLAAQTEPDWEWVVLRNGDRPGPVPAEARADARVRVFDSDRVGVGALKRAAAGLCAGEILVELDHDDMLTPDCLAALAEAECGTENGFYYSDWTGVRPDGSAEDYDAKYGWEKYEAEVLGRTRHCLRAFPPTARSLCEVMFAPNHVRAWHRAAYEKAGGHAEALPVGDDHDLVCRTYLAGVPFVHVPAPLYHYRASEASTHVLRADEVQRVCARNRDTYLHPLVREWCRRAALPMLDLGGAVGCPDGYIPVDSALPYDPHARFHGLAGKPLAEWPTSIAWNALGVLKALPDRSVGCIRAFDFLEHLPRADMVPLMNEAYRVLVAGGWLLTATPSTDGRGAFQDPTHTNFLNENSFWYYTQGKYAGYLHGRVTARFQAVRLFTACPSDWHARNKIPYVYADLCAAKGGRHPGPVYI